MLLLKKKKIPFLSVVELLLSNKIIAEKGNISRPQEMEGVKL